MGKGGKGEIDGDGVILKLCPVGLRSGLLVKTLTFGELFSLSR